MMQSFLRADEVGLLIGDYFDHTASPLRPGIAPVALAYRILNAITLRDSLVLAFCA